jgi:hypothetical protein
VLLRGVDGVASVEGGTAQPHDLGTRLAPEDGVTSLIVHI